MRMQKRRLIAAFLLLILAWCLTSTASFLSYPLDSMMAGYRLSSFLDASDENTEGVFTRPRSCFAQFNIHYPDFELIVRSYPANPWKKWGLGTSEDEYVSNDPGYDWYINQNRTGTYGFENCGPASVTMACEWSDPYFDHKTEEARETFHSSGGWWYMEDIADYMEIYDIPYNEEDNTGDASILEELRRGNILIINIDLRGMSYNSNPAQHVDKFYSGGSGHFIIIKGFAEIDNKLFYECYDPATQSFYYSVDHEPMGKDRYYRASDIQNAMRIWYNTYLVVLPKYQ